MAKKPIFLKRWRLSKSGKEIPISLKVSPIKDSHGKIIGASKIARNNEEQIRYRERIKAYNHKLQILNSVGKDISSNLDVESVLQKVCDACTLLSGAEFGAFFYSTENENGESFILSKVSGIPKEGFIKVETPEFRHFLEETVVIRENDISQDIPSFLDHTLKDLDNKPFSIKSFMKIPVISSSGKVIGAIIFGHPQKEIFQQEQETIIMSVAAQAAITLENSRLFERVNALNNKKDEFIALASHELKTPLTTVKGYLQILDKKISDPSSRVFLAKTIEHANKIHTLIDDLLNMSRIEAGKLDFNYQEFDLKEMLLDVAETFEHGNPSHELLTNLDEKPVMIEADKQRLEQVLSNLLSNAVKYSPLGHKVYLDLSIEQDRVRVSVKDEGIGLTEQQQKQVFSRFYRAESTKGINGLGLGLYITKQIIDAHQGDLGVNSEAGKGSEFYFTLPLPKSI